MEKTQYLSIRIGNILNTIRIGQIIVKVINFSDKTVNITISNRRVIKHKRYLEEIIMIRECLSAGNQGGDRLPELQKSIQK